MTNQLSKQQFIQLVLQILDRLEASADQLNRLDAAVGDGDLGVTITLGSRAVRDSLHSLADQDLGSIMARAGMAFNSAAPSTMGALMAIGSMRAGREARGAHQLDLPLLARAARAFESAIQEKGQASRGDKTMLDALGPAADALEQALTEGKSLEQATRDAANAANAGVEATIPLKAKSGRAAWITDRTAGQPDPGATVVSIIWQAIADFLDHPSA